MVPEITDPTWGILQWLVPTLLIIFVLPRFARWGALIARLLLHIGDKV